MQLQRFHPGFFQKERKEMFKIYMELNKMWYESGQHVHGCVHLSVTGASSFTHLEIVVRGIENVAWTRSTGQMSYDAGQTQEIGSTIKSYEDSFVLYDFPETEIPLGNYSFPYTFKLPQFLPGSTYQGPNCYIRYDIIVRIKSPKTGYKRTDYRALNIMEPSRSLLNTASIARTIHSECCGCFCDYGSTTTILKCNKSFIRSGQHYEIEGLIDNKNGKISIKSGRIKYEEIVYMSSDGRLRENIIDQKVLYEFNREIYPQEIYPFKFSDKISPKLKTSTAIGLIVARCFIIRLETEYGCCTQTAAATLHLIVQSKFPQGRTVLAQPKPTNFKSKEFPCVVCESMRPFFINRNTLIPYYNLPVEKEEVKLPPDFLFLTYAGGPHLDKKEEQHPNPSENGDPKQPHEVPKGQPPYFVNNGDNSESNNNLARNLYLD